MGFSFQQQACWPNTLDCNPHAALGSIYVSVSELDRVSKFHQTRKKVNWKCQKAGQRWLFCNQCLCTIVKQQSVWFGDPGDQCRNHRANVHHHIYKYIIHYTQYTYIYVQWPPPHANQRQLRLLIHTASSYFPSYHFHSWELSIINNHGQLQWGTDSQASLYSKCISQPSWSTGLHFIVSLT